MKELLCLLVLASLVLLLPLYDLHYIFSLISLCWVFFNPFSLALACLQSSLRQPPVALAVLLQTKLLRFKPISLHN